MYILLIIVAFVLYIKFKANSVKHGEVVEPENSFDELNEPTSSVKPNGSTIIEDYIKQGLEFNKPQAGVWDKKQNTSNGKVDKLTELENKISSTKPLTDKQIKSAEKATKQSPIKEDKITQLVGDVNKTIDSRLNNKL